MLSLAIIKTRADEMADENVMDTKKHFFDLLNCTFLYLNAPLNTKFSISSEIELMHCTFICFTFIFLPNWFYFSVIKCSDFICRCHSTAYATHD